MKRPIVIAVLGLLAAIGIAIVLLRADNDAATSTSPAGSASAAARDPLVEEFRAVERASLSAYNAALRDQRENRIDELELSNVIERDVLTPWRAMRARVTAGAVPPGSDALYATLRRYLEERQVSWEAYVRALRAPSDALAAPHFEAHRQKNADAQDAARELGRIFREAGL